MQLETSIAAAWSMAVNASESVKDTTRYWGILLHCKGFSTIMVLFRMQEYDGAEPAASSIAIANLFRLAALSSSAAGQK